MIESAFVAKSGIKPRPANRFLVHPCDQKSWACRPPSPESCCNCNNIQHAGDQAVTSGIQIPSLPWENSMSTRKRRWWLHMSAEPVCQLFALWRRERDDARFCGTDPADRMSAAARVSGPLGDTGAQKRRSAWWKDDWIAEQTDRMS
jgi:hypothetical protein